MPNHDTKERTTVLHKPKEMINASLHVYSHISEYMDAICDDRGVEVTIHTKAIWNGMELLKSKGVRLRWITDITKDNLNWCKEFVKIVEVRHIDRIKGAFGVHDNKYYLASANVLSGGKIFPAELIVSNVKVIVQQQQQIFDLLWDKAIPARERFREIEKGLRREFIDTIRDPHDIVKTIFTVIGSVTENIQILFCNYLALKRFLDIGLFNYLRGLRSGNSIEARILILVIDRMEVKKIEKELAIIKVDGYKNRNMFHFRYLTKNYFDSKLTTFIADSTLSLAIEIKDSDMNDLFEDSSAIAIYSNNQSTVDTYSIIFENLWNQSEIEMDAIS
jgi:hypothetical protein